jgi:metal-responsive CopG/Arc/MetJ family transcriptional regulator
MCDRQMNESRITVRFPAALRRSLKNLARRTGTRESDLIRKAVERHLETEQEAPTIYEYAKRAGVIGIIGDAPHDLSTNPKHFDGFGRS